VSDELQLYFEQSGSSNLVSNLGRLIIHSVERHPTVDGLGFDVELLQADVEHLKTSPPPHWVAFHAYAETQQRPNRVLGAIPIDEHQRPAFSPPAMNTQTRVRWPWQLTPEDIELVERTRSHDQGAPVWLNLRIEAIAQTESGTLGVTGASSFRIEISKWQTLLKGIGFTVGPSGIVALSGANLDDASWRKAEKRLEAPREHLREGEDYAALESCLGELEKIVSKPFMSDNWKNSVFVGMPEQKRDSLAAWMGGFGTTLNRVGHHKDRSDRDEAGDLREMPLNHWEAELIVQSTHFALAYALRLRTK
jgi:hypothetical protein